MNTPIALSGTAGTVFGVTSFLRLVEDLLREPTERAAYVADPAGYLPARGFGDFEPADVELSLQLSADAFPPAVAELIDPSAGLDTIVSVDIDALPGLWNGIDSDELAFEELGELDDPFLEGLDDHTGPETGDTVDVDDVPDANDDAPIGQGSPEPPSELAAETADPAGSGEPDGLTASPESSLHIDPDAGFDSDLDDAALNEPDFSTLDAFDGSGDDVEDGLFE